MTGGDHRLRIRLEAGFLALGMGLRQIRTADIGRLLAVTDYDWALIDLEHGPMSIDTANHMSVACEMAGVTPLVRVPKNEVNMATRLLDGGAMGIVFPHVNTAEEARHLVDACLYPPTGSRSMGGSRLAQLGFRVESRDRAAAAGNEATFLVAMIETPDAVNNADAIAACPGVDALLIGSNDLTLAMGIPGKLDHPRLAEAYAAVSKACAAHGKHMGMGGVDDLASMGRYIEMGARLILAGGDTSLFIQGASARAKELRTLQQTEGPGPT